MKFGSFCKNHFNGYANANYINKTVLNPVFRSLQASREA